MEKLNPYAGEPTVSGTDDFNQQVVSKINEIIEWINEHERAKGHIEFTQSEPCVGSMDLDWYKIYMRETNDTIDNEWEKK